MCREHIKPGERGGYQRKKYIKALEYVKQRRRALDIGAHIGLWSLDMIKDFEVVEAFEPVALHRECYVRNVKGSNLYPFACGDKPDRVSLGTPKEGFTGHTVVVPGDDVEVVVLDDYGFTDVDFVKVDCEGYEYFVLKGLEQTILRDRPVIIVEQKPENADRYGLKTDRALHYLIELGMLLKARLGGDYVLQWKH